MLSQSDEMRKNTKFGTVILVFRSKVQIEQALFRAMTNERSLFVGV